MVCIVSQESLLKENINLKYERTTLGFVQVWLDKQTSANCKSGLWFGLDKQLWALVLNFNISFQSAAAVGGRNTNATPAQSPARCVQFY